jgi:hypothetical protein
MVSTEPYNSIEGLAIGGWSRLDFPASDLVMLERPMQPFIDIYLRNHVAQLTVAKEMRGAIHKYFGPSYPHH